MFNLYLVLVVCGLVMLTVELVVTRKVFAGMGWQMWAYRIGTGLVLVFTGLAVPGAIINSACIRWSKWYLKKHPL